jgi:hypothetical protein
MVEDATTWWVVWCWVLIMSVVERGGLWLVASLGYVGAVLAAVLAFRLRAWHLAWQCRVSASPSQWVSLSSGVIPLSVGPAQACLVGWIRARAVRTVSVPALECSNIGSRLCTGCR